MITEVGWDGSIRRSALETAGLPDARRWDYLIEQVLAVPPRYQATPGSPVYVIHAGARAVLVGQQNLAGPLYELVSIIQQRGSPALAAKQLHLQWRRRRWRRRAWTQLVVARHAQREAGPEALSWLARIVR